MNIKVNKKLIAMILTGLTVTLSSCSNEKISDVTVVETIEEEPVIDEVEEKIIEEELNVGKVEEIDPDSIEYNINYIQVVVCDTKTPINDSMNTKLGNFVPNRCFNLLSDENPDYYEIEYYGDTGFVSRTDTHTEIRPVVNIPMISKGYLEKEATIYINKELSEEITTLPGLEFIEIYKELDDCYLVQTNNYDIGYIKKEDVTILEGNVAITDISNQEVRFYEGNDLMLTAPIVSGTPNTGRESDKGLTNIISKWGAGWITPTAYVQCVAYFNYTYEGYHTAEWRTLDEFGGDTYITNGSHGCINMRTDDAKYLCGELEVGDWCLVKE